MSEILKSKDMILKEWEINESCSGKKRENPQKFLRINEYLWKWYVLCRHSNVPVSELMLQEEALITSVRLGENSMSFTASNGRLSKWKKGTTSVKWWLERKVTSVKKLCPAGMNVHVN